MDNKMDIFFKTSGEVVFLYDEGLDLSGLGKVTNKRLSFVEPMAGSSQWEVLMVGSDVKLGPFDSRSEALQAEKEYILQNNLLMGCSVR